MAAKSPFPGLDPFVEQSGWGNYHSSLIVYIRDALNDRLPADLRGQSDERVYVDDRVLTTDPDGRRRLEPQTYVPDVYVAVVRSSETSGGTATAEHEPVAAPTEHLHLRVDFHEGFVEIVESGPGGRLIAVIEIVSPSNRVKGEGRRLYRRKQRDCERSGVNLIELDFVRTGTSVTRAGRVRPDDADHWRPHISAWDAQRPDVTERYAIDLRRPLPTIGIPLRAGEPRVALNLQGLHDTAYGRGRFNIDYSQSLDPPVPGADGEWVRSVIRALPTATKQAPAS